MGLRVSKVIWGSFGALVSKWPVTRKWLTIERNRMKFGTLGQLSHVYGVPLPFYCFGSFFRSFGALVSKWRATRKRKAMERKEVKFGTREYL